MLRRICRNVSSYVTFTASSMAMRISRGSPRPTLDPADVNNVYVSSINHGYDARAFIDAMPRSRSSRYTRAPDQRTSSTLDAPVVDSVWDLYSMRCGALGRSRR
jgi:uncharacterized protein (UPF0276 family)